MKDKRLLDKAGVGQAEAAQPDPHTQIPTIKDAITYIVDKDGNEIKQNPVASSQEPEVKSQD